MYDNLSKVIEVDINDILPNRFQPRIQFNEEEILELSDSIKEHGVIQPLVVRPIGDKYEIIAGERRYKASVLAGRETVPVIVKNLDDKESAEIALIENVQRKNLTPVEEALSYKKILDMGYLTQESLANKIGKSQSSVANKIRLLNLSDEVQEALLENKISERHARSLLRLTGVEDQNKMLNRIISERLTVRKTDEEIDKLNESSSFNTNIEENKKIEEKGEINMNNNISGMFNVPNNSQQTLESQFNSQMPSMPSFGFGPSEPIKENTVFPSFDIFGGSSNSMSNVQPQAPTMPDFTAPTVDSILGANPNNMPSAQQQAPAMPDFTAPTVDSILGTNPNNMPNTQQQAPAMPDFTAPTVDSILGTNPNNMPNAQQQAPAMPDFTAPTVDSILGGTQNSDINNFYPSLENNVPKTSPIIEPSQFNQYSNQDFNNNLNSFNQQPVSQPEITMPEPIIVTDYTKQYDPVMPQLEQDIAPTVDFKEVINAIRDCSNKIEQYGFKIDVEEYDLTNLYQVVFKIEK